MILRPKLTTTACMLFLAGTVPAFGQRQGPQRPQNYPSAEYNQPVSHQQSIGYTQPASHPLQASYQQPGAIPHPTAAQPTGPLPPSVPTQQPMTNRLPAVNDLPQAPPGYELRRVEGVFHLNQLVQIADQQHPVLTRAWAEVESAKGDRVQAALYPNPRMETNNPEFWAGKTSQVNFGWQQDVITKGKIRLDKAVADQEVRKKLAQYNLERFRMLTELRDQYYQVLASRQRVDTAEQFVRLSEQAYQTAKKLVDAGQGSTTDALLIDTELERSRVNLDNARTNLAGELSQLSCITGVPDLMIRDVQGSIFDIPPDFDEKEIRQFLVTQSIHMEIAHAEISRRQMKLRREEVEPYPDLRFGPSFAAPTDTNRGQFWLSVVFDIPVWNLNQGNIRQARAEMQGATANMDSTRIDLLQKLSATSARYIAARNASERIRNSILPNAVKAQQLVGEGFERGLFDVNRVLQARRSLLETNNDLIDACERAWSAAAQLAGHLQQEQFP